MRPTVGGQWEIKILQALQLSAILEDPLFRGTIMLNSITGHAMMITQ